MKKMILVASCVTLILLGGSPGKVLALETLPKVLPTEEASAIVPYFVSISSVVGNITVSGTTIKASVTVGVDSITRNTS
ncbi:MAG: hypothetical protein PHE06_02045 [Lachnospiraceae bacterium]|nr:hypothetical protein [Lachnospiraceae bacterium]